MFGADNLFGGKCQKHRKAHVHIRNFIKKAARIMKDIRNRFFVLIGKRLVKGRKDLTADTAFHEHGIAEKLVDGLHKAVDL